MSGFDLSEASAMLDREEQGQVVHLRDAAGEELYHGDDPVTLTVAGTYSKRYRKAFDAKVSKITTRRREREEMQRDAHELIASCVLAWSGFLENGQPLECTRPNVLRVLELAPWVREQVETAMEDHAGFSRASSAS